jgi:hypothetical protein
MKWARDMTEAEIRAELADLEAEMDEYVTIDDDDKAHGGSPVEGMYERHEELTKALAKLQPAK